MGIEPVIIVGAGICGLTIAQGLQKANIDCVIYESADESIICSTEWTTGLYWSLGMLRSLLPEGHAGRLKPEAAVDKFLDYDRYPNDTISVFDSVLGEPAGEIMAKGDYLRVSRTKLITLCHEGINVKYGHNLQNIECLDDGRVVAVFANGKRQVGCIIVGADGSRSKVRELLFGPEKTRLVPFDAVCIKASVCYSDAAKATFVRGANPVTSIAIHRECMASISIEDVPDAVRSETWRFELQVSWKSEKNSKASNQTVRQKLKGYAQILNEPFRSAVLWLPENTEILEEQVESWTPKPWYTRGGRVTLAGDAAHPTPSIGGHTLDHTIMDAYNFVETVKDIVYGNRLKAEAIPSYGNEVAVRGAKNVQWVKQKANLMLDYAKFKESGPENCLWTTMQEEVDSCERLARSRTRRNSGRSSMVNIKPEVSEMWSSTKHWLKQTIGYATQGSSQGQVRSSWVDLAHRQYARRRFPD